MVCWDSEVLYYYYYYFYPFTPFEFFIPELAGGLSLESEWQQVSPCLQDRFEYSGRSPLRCSLDGPRLSSNLQLFQLLIKPFCIVPSAPISLVITVTFMFHRFLGLWQGLSIILIIIIIIIIINALKNIPSFWETKLRSHHYSQELETSFQTSTERQLFFISTFVTLTDILSKNISYVIVVDIIIIIIIIVNFFLFLLLFLFFFLIDLMISFF